MRHHAVSLCCDLFTTHCPPQPSVLWLLQTVLLSCVDTSPGVFCCVRLYLVWCVEVSAVFGVLVNYTERQDLVISCPNNCR